MPDFSIIDILFLPVIFLLGIVTSYEDIKYGKIRNKWIFWGFLYWLVLFCAFFLWNFYFDSIFSYFSDNIKLTSLIQFEHDYLIAVVVNGFVALFFVFVLWEFGIIAAGDAKLFWLYSLLVPFTYYWKTYLYFFPSLILFFNTFVVIVVYLFVVSVLSYLQDNKGRYKESILNKLTDIKRKFKSGKLGYKVIIGPVIGFLAVMITINLIANHFSIEIKNLPAYVVIILFYFRRILTQFFVRKDIMSYVGAYLAVMILIGLSIDAVFVAGLIWNIVKMLTVILTILTIVAAFINRYITKSSVDEMNVADLEGGMMLDSDFIRKLKMDKRYFQEKIGRIYFGTLNDNQTKAVKKWAARNKIEKVQIFKPFRLAIWVFLGVITTMVYQGSIIKLLMK